MVAAEPQRIVASSPCHGAMHADADNGHNVSESRGSHTHDRERKPSVSIHILHNFNATEGIDSTLTPSPQADSLSLFRQLLLRR